MRRLLCRKLFRFWLKKAIFLSLCRARNATFCSMRRLLLEGCSTPPHDSIAMATQTARHLLRGSCPLLRVHFLDSVPFWARSTLSVFIAVQRAWLSGYEARAPHSLWEQSRTAFLLARLKLCRRSHRRPELVPSSRGPVRSPAEHMLCKWLVAVSLSL